MLERYNRIISKLKEAKASNDLDRVKHWRFKLQEWQTEYGASCPIQ
jgi:hypothetical protein